MHGNQQFMLAPSNMPTTRGHLHTIVAGIGQQASGLKTKYRLAYYILKTGTSRMLSAAQQLLDNDGRVPPQYRDWKQFLLAHLFPGTGGNSELIQGVLLNLTLNRAWRRIDKNLKAKGIRINLGDWVMSLRRYYQKRGDIKQGADEHVRKSWKRYQNGDDSPPPGRPTARPSPEQPSGYWNQSKTDYRYDTDYSLDDDDTFFIKATRANDLTTVTDRSNGLAAHIPWKYISTTKTGIRYQTSACAAILHRIPELTSESEPIQMKTGSSASGTMKESKDAEAIVLGLVPCWAVLDNRTMTASDHQMIQTLTTLADRLDAELLIQASDVWASNDVGVREQITKIIQQYGFTSRGNKDLHRFPLRRQSINQVIASAGLTVTPIGGRQSVTLAPTRASDIGLEPNIVESFTVTV
jgi:hypothetical protein